MQIVHFTKLFPLMFPLAETKSKAQTQAHTRPNVYNITQTSV